MIEVWEKLDCESVGASEIVAIETVVRDVFGESAVDSPMVVARLLADEGAELRHHEVMRLYLERASERPYDAAFLNILETTDLKSTLQSIRRMENLRRKLESENDREGSRLLRQLAIDEKQRKLDSAERPRIDPSRRAELLEVAEWLTLWLQSPELFDGWVLLRQRSQDFVSKFGEVV